MEQLRGAADLKGKAFEVREKQSWLAEYPDIKNIPARVCNREKSMKIDVSENGAVSAPDGSSLFLFGHSEWGLIRIKVKYADLLNAFGLCDASDSQRWNVWGSRDQNKKALAQIAIRLYEAGRFLASPFARTIDIPTDELRRSKAHFDTTSVLPSAHTVSLY